MSDTSILGGALGLGNPAYDPDQAKGYLADLKKDTAKTEGEYNDVVAKRRERLGQMEDIVKQATQSLLQAREGRVNLPLLAAAAGMMAPTRTGGMGEALSNAGRAAVPALQAQREGDDRDIMQQTNLRTLPLTMGEAIDKDAQSQLATRSNAMLGQQLGINKGMLSAGVAGMKFGAKELNDLRKQAAQEARNEMMAAQRQGTQFEGDEATVLNKMTDVKYAQMFYAKYGKWPSQVMSGREDMPPSEIEKTLPKMPGVVGNTLLRKQAEAEAKAQMQAAQKNGTVYDADDATVMKNLTENRYAELYKQRFNTMPPGMTETPGVPRAIEKESKDDLKKAGEMRDAGNTANSSFNNLNALDFENTTQGVLAPVVEELGRWASSFGISGGAIDDLRKSSANITEFKKITAQTLQDIQNKAKGTQTEGDAKRIAEAMQRVTNSKEANQLIRGYLQSQNIAAMYAQDIGNEYIAGQRNRATGIDKHLNEQTRMPLTHTVNGKTITLYDAYVSMRAKNPAMPSDQAMRETVKLWKQGTGG